MQRTPPPLVVEHGVLGRPTLLARSALVGARREIVGKEIRKGGQTHAKTTRDAGKRRENGTTSWTTRRGALNNGRVGRANGGATKHNTASLRLPVARRSPSDTQDCTSYGTRPSTQASSTLQARA